MEKSNKPLPSAATTNPLQTTMSPATPASNLYDSYEFRAMTKQLNRAIKGSNSPLSPYSSYLRSATPFYSNQLTRICGKRGTNTTKRILSSKMEDSPNSAKGLVWRIWKKVKSSFARSN